MTIQQLEADVSTLKFDFPNLSESTAYAVACDEYSTDELLELKRRLDLSSEEFIETVKFIEQRGGLDGNEVGDNTKPVDVERTDGRANTNPDEVTEE